MAGLEFSVGNRLTSTSNLGLSGTESMIISTTLYSLASVKFFLNAITMGSYDVLLE